MTYLYRQKNKRPDHAIDPILVGARLAESLAALPREVSPFIPATLSVCRFSGGTNANVIPDTVELEGTLRFFDKTVGKKLVTRMRKLCRALSASLGATCEFTYTDPYVATRNHAHAVELGQRVAVRLLGENRWQLAHEPTMGGEDFAYYLQKQPGAMFWLGLGEKSRGLHNPHFDFNDRVLHNGVLFLAGCALEALA